MHNNVACTWSSLFEPIARKYFEKKHSVSVFGHSLSLNFAENDPLFGKITCSPDGYFLNSDNELVLLEIKCPFKRDIAKNCIPSYYKDQIQTDLSLSGESVNKGLFIDNQFRICSLHQIEPSSSHNSTINGGKLYRAKKRISTCMGHLLLIQQTKTKLQTKKHNRSRFSEVFQAVWKDNGLSRGEGNLLCIRCC